MPGALAHFPRHFPFSLIGLNHPTRSTCLVVVLSLALRARNAPGRHSALDLALLEGDRKLLAQVLVADKRGSCDSSRALLHPRLEPEQTVAM